MKIIDLIACARKDFSLENILNFLNENPKEIQSLLDLATKEKKYPLPDYSSWVLIHLSEKNPAQVEKHLPQIIDGFLASDNQSVLRNLLKVITLFPKNKHREEALINRLFDVFIEPQNKVALLVYSAYQLKKYFIEFPEFKNELVEILRMKLEKEKSPALKVALRNVLKD